MEDYIGRIAAGTLGYIHGNTRGAIVANQMYSRFKPYFWRKNLNKNIQMAPTPKRLSKSKPSVRIGRKPSLRGPPVRGRSMSVSSGVSSKSAASSSLKRILFSQSASGTSGIKSVASKRKGGKVAKEGIKKKVKVPKLLRKQVKQILSTSFPHTGTFCETFAEKKYFNDFGQSLRSVGNQSNVIRQHFDPNYVMHAASVLFNQKAGTPTPLIVDPRNFNPRTTLIKVLKQSATYRFKNNSGRTMTIKIYAWSPKGKLPSAQDDPATMWIETMANEANASNKLNINSASPNTLYATPYMCRTLMQTFTFDCTTVVLEAGKEYNYVLNGPNNMDYDFSKFWDPTSSTPDFQNQQKFIKGVFIVGYYDQAATTTGAPSRQVSFASGSPYGLLVETTNYIKLAMPEQTGLVDPGTIVAGDPVPLSNRKIKPYYLANWYLQGALGDSAYVNDNAPNIPATSGI